MKSVLLSLFITFFTLLSSTESKAQTLLAEGVNSADALFDSMENNRQWPSYRGYFASGFLDDAHLPDSFNIESSFNVKWNI